MALEYYILNFVYSSHGISKSNYHIKCQYLTNNYAWKIINFIGKSLDIQDIWFSSRRRSRRIWEFIQLSKQLIEIIMRKFV